MVKHNNAGDSRELDNESTALLNYIKERRRCRVEEILDYALRSLGLETYKAAKLLYGLKERGLVSIIDPRPPRSLLGYFLSSHTIWFWLIVALIIVAILSIYILPARPPTIYLRYVVGSIFILYLPGASLIELLYPSGQELSQLERLALSIGLSLALVPLVGLVLNYTPWGIRLDPIVASLSALTITLASGAVARKYHLARLASAQLTGEQG